MAAHLGMTNNWQGVQIGYNTNNMFWWTGPVKLNQVLIRPVHRSFIVNDILPRLAGEKSSHLTTFSC